MATIYYKDKQAEVANGAYIFDTCAQMGMPIALGCCNGFCGGCRATIAKGRENIEDGSEATYLNSNEVLLCKSRILKGEVFIEY